MATAIQTYNSLKPVQAVRKARRAYVGLFGMAYDRAALRLAKLRATRETLMNDFITKGETIEADAQDMIKDAQSKAGDMAADAGTKAARMIPNLTLPALTGRKAARIAELQGEIEALSTKLDGMKKAAKKPAVKKTSAKKAAVKTAAAKTAAPKTAAVEAPASEVKVETTAEIKAETPVVTVEAKVEAVDKYAAHYEAVKAYDADADAAIVRKIVNHLGIALQSRDGQYVACSDESERDTVRDSWLVKKLGVEGETEALNDKVFAICKAMQADRMKSRVTFYYLLAKQEGKLAAL